MPSNTGPEPRGGGWRSWTRALGLTLAACGLPGGQAAEDATAADPTPPACSVPVDAIRIDPGQDVQAVMQRQPPGSAFLLGAGMHRGVRLTPRDGDRFFGERDSDCRRLAVISGARELAGFSRWSSLYFVGGQSSEASPHGQCAAGYEGCERREQLFIDGVLQRHVDRLERVEHDTWHFAYTENRVYLGNPPQGRRVELSIEPHAFDGNARDVTIEGLVIEKFAIPAQLGAVGGKGQGSGWRVVDNEIRWNHGAGVSVGPNGRIVRNHVHHNGQLGLTANGAGVLVEANEISHNNQAGFDAKWEAGGAKFTETLGLTLRGNCVHHNDGPGLWNDVNARETLYEDNIVFENRGEGIFHEISHGAVIRGNRVGRNGRSGGWLYGANILVSSSVRAVVEENLVEVAPDFGNAIAVIVQDRDDAQVLERVEVRRNDIRFTGAGGMAGAAADFERGRREIFERVTFSENRYALRDSGRAHFEWLGAPRSFGEFQKLGQGRGGEIVRRAEAIDWNCTGIASSRPPAPSPPR